MATIGNRSKYQVTVKNWPDLTLKFPFNRLANVEAHVADVRAQGLKPRGDQEEDQFLVRIRQKGYPSRTSLEERLQSVARATLDRELDILRSVFTVATRVWDYNPRERRISADEERRLADALAHQDFERAVEQRLQVLVEDSLSGQARMSPQNASSSPAAALHIERAPISEETTWGRRRSRGVHFFGILAHTACSGPGASDLIRDVSASDPIVAAFRALREIVCYRRISSLMQASKCR